MYDDDADHDDDELNESRAVRLYTERTVAVAAADDDDAKWRTTTTRDEASEREAGK